MLKRKWLTFLGLIAALYIIAALVIVIATASEIVHAEVRPYSLVAGEGTDWNSIIEVQDFLQASVVDSIDELGWQCREYTWALIVEAELIDRQLVPYYCLVEGTLHVMIEAQLESGCKIIIEPQNDRMWYERPGGLEVQVVKCVYPPNTHKRIILHRAINS